MIYKYFSTDELKCQHCGAEGMDDSFMVKVEALREELRFPFVVTSGYRCKDHPIEAKKEVPGCHAQGIAADIKITNAVFRLKLVTEAIRLGFTGIGVASDFIHIDTRGTTPVMWTY